MSTLGLSKEKYQIDGYLWDDKGVMLINGVIGMIIP
jgi:hypothetical protein